jgi:glycosyltransferase involved in cell wall biosynthesis
MRTGVILDGDFINDPRVINETRILEEAGHMVFVLNLPTKDTGPVINYSSNISLIKASFSKRINNYLFALENLIPLYDLLWHHEIADLVKKYGIEVLHAHDLYMAKAAGKAAKEFRIPLIVDLHENFPAAIKEYSWATRFPSRMVVRPAKWGKKEREYLHYADRIILLSSNYREYLISKYPDIDPGKILIYPNVPDIKKLLSYKIDREIFPSEDKDIIFYFGLISRRRGILTAVKAILEALPAHPRLHLLLIGPIDKAERDEFMKVFLNNNLKGHLTYFPWRDISEFPSFVECSRICISPVIKNPQHESGVANKVFQYMLFGRPLLVSDCTPQYEIIRNTGCGLAFKSDDPSDMAARLSELLSDPARCRNMGEKGRKAIFEEYNTEIQGRAILQAYAGL